MSFDAKTVKLSSQPMVRLWAHPSEKALEMWKGWVQEVIRERKNLCVEAGRSISRREASIYAAQKFIKEGGPKIEVIENSEPIVNGVPDTRYKRIKLNGLGFYENQEETENGAIGLIGLLWSGLLAGGPMGTSKNVSSKSIVYVNVLSDPKEAAGIFNFAMHQGAELKKWLHGGIEASASKQEQERDSYYKDPFPLISQLSGATCLDWIAPRSGARLDEPDGQWRGALVIEEELVFVPLLSLALIESMHAHDQHTQMMNSKVLWNLPAFAEAKKRVEKKKHESIEESLLPQSIMNWRRVAQEHTSQIFNIAHMCSDESYKEHVPNWLRALYDANKSAFKVEYVLKCIEQSGQGWVKFEEDFLSECMKLKETKGLSAVQSVHKISRI